MTFEELLAALRHSKWVLTPKLESNFHCLLGDGDSYTTDYSCKYPSQIEASVSVPYMSNDLLEDLRYHWQTIHQPVGGWIVSDNLPPDLAEKIADMVERRIVYTEEQSTQVYEDGDWAAPVEGPSSGPYGRHQMTLKRATFKAEGRKFVVTLVVDIKICNEWHTSWDRSWK